MKTTEDNCNSCHFGDTRNDELECHYDSPSFKGIDGVWPRVKWFQWRGKFQERKENNE